MWLPSQRQLSCWRFLTLRRIVGAPVRVPPSPALPNAPGKSCEHRGRGFAPTPVECENISQEIVSGGNTDGDVRTDLSCTARNTSALQNLVRRQDRREHRGGTVHGAS